MPFIDLEVVDICMATLETKWTSITILLTLQLRSTRILLSVVFRIMLLKS